MFDVHDGSSGGDFPCSELTYNRARLAAFVGQFYLDLFPRQNKFSHAAMFSELRSGSALNHALRDVGAQR